jgi:hypothetical protein
MAMQTPPRQNPGQQGAALLIFLVLLVMAALTYVVNSLSPEALRSRRAQTNADVLRQAQEALIGYTLKFRDEQLKDGQTGVVYGYLPLPDLGTSRNQNTGCTDEGCDAANFSGNGANVSIVGRFPWRALGIPPLRDGNGECLWYAVSGSHQRIHMSSPLNWDTLGQFDIVIADGSTAMASTLSSAHDRPIAVIFSPGPILPGQDRSPSATDTVTECGGNYTASNYLDPGPQPNGTQLDGTTNYFSGASNAASGDTSSATKSLSASGTVQRQSDGHLWAGACPSGATCALAANDRGLALTGDTLFAALRKSAYFRNDINSLLDRMTTCLRDRIVANTNLTVSAISGFAIPGDKLAGRVADDSCYGDTQEPLGYYSHYKDLLFVGQPLAGSFTVTADGVAQTCAGVVLFAAQRSSSQTRTTTTEKNAPANYLEGDNLTSFTATGTNFAGPTVFSRVSAGQTANQDIVRCIPAGASLTAVESTQLTAQGVGQLTSYDAASSTLTLGQLNAESDQGVTAQALFGCAWQPEAHVTSSGMRSYFKFNIQNTGSAGEGFVFAMIDGDINASNVCGAARQHLGYSGNNGYTPYIDYPKIGIEIDTRRNNRSNASFTDPSGFDPSYIGASPSSTSYLNNGRADPNYTGGHIGIVYWGGESPISTGRACGSGCVAPQYCSAGICYLSQEEDDNVHGRSATVTSTRPPPQNPVAPASPAVAPAGVYKLDPSLSQVPTNQDIHVRVELTRTYPLDDYNSRPVRVVATTDTALSGLPMIDGVAVASGDRVLLTAQASGAQNGVYAAAAGSWSRATSEDDIWDMPPGTGWIVREGTTYAGSYWRFNSPDSYTLGTDAITIAKATPSWKVAATSDVTTSGLQQVGGVQLAENDYVLLTAQLSSSDNGLYQVHAGAWTAIPMYQGGYTIQAWVLKDSATDANRITDMKMTSRPMAELDSSYSPHLSGSTTIYNPATGACSGNAQCPSGQWCGLDNNCYRPAFRTIRMGFTNAQSTQDQIISISNFGTTWLP